MGNLELSHEKMRRIKTVGQGVREHKKFSRKQEIGREKTEEMGDKSERVLKYG